MEAYQTIYNPSFQAVIKRQSLVSTFFNWCQTQEKNRLGWLGLILAIHGCVITPITLFAIVMAGNNIAFWGIAMGAMAMSLITNLAALPTKITIPVFIFSIIVDLAVIGTCLFAIFSH
jgi:hypothetical protein